MDERHSRLVASLIHGLCYQLVDSASVAISSVALKFCWRQSHGNRQLKFKRIGW